MVKIRTPWYSATMRTTSTIEISRRQLLAAAGAAAAGLALGNSHALAGSRGAAPVPSLIVPRPDRKRSIRIGHLTDIHVQPEKRAAEGLAACLAHVGSLKDKPELILTGGDSVMDCFDADRARTDVQWNLWHKVWKENCTIPVRSAVGNHDAWGWNKKASKATGTEPLYGKAMAEEMLRIPKRYYSFDQAGWHFVILDSIFPEGDGYIGKIDDEQLEWLRGDLAAVNPKTPVLVLSHIPILSVAAVMYDNFTRNGQITLPRGEMHTDVYALKDLFLKHPNVKLCLSGHIHLLDDVRFNGVAYLCNGAVCGKWWKGRVQQCGEGYAILDLYDDGTFTNEYLEYDWKAEAEK